MDGEVLIRAERPGDGPAIARVNALAFETPAEARLVDALRAGGRLAVSLVAERGGEVVGHIAFSPVRANSHPDAIGLGLGPMAVLPELQRRGIGSRLVREGLERCSAAGAAFAVVLGHPEYYPRFGFRPASACRLTCKWPVPEGVFMAMELEAGALADVSGMVCYEPEFDEV